MEQKSPKDVLRDLANEKNRIAFLRDKKDYYWVTITKPGSKIKGRRRSGKGKNIHLENALILALASLFPDTGIPVRNDPLVLAIVAKLVPGKPFFLKPDDPLLV